jgi:hypothetical protein
MFKTRVLKEKNDGQQSPDGGGDGRNQDGQTNAEAISRLRSGMVRAPRTDWKGKALRIAPWFFLFMTVFGINGKVSRIDKQLDGETTPILVQVGTDATPILAKRASEGALNAANVEQFLGECLPLLWRGDATLPDEAGGGQDEGVKLAKTLVPTPMYLARSCLNPAIAESWIEARASTLPKDTWKGARQTIAGLQIGEVKPVKGNPLRRAIVCVGMLVTDNPDGTPRAAQQWARTFIVQGVQKPRYVLKPSSIEEKYNHFLKRRLQIVDIDNAPEVLP